MVDAATEEIRQSLKADDFSKARRLLETLLGSFGLDPKTLTWARQKLALSTYKDKEIQSEVALEKALEVLASEGLQDTADPETLGLAGAIHKRLWEINGDVRELTRSLAYYERARDAGKKKLESEKSSLEKKDEHLEKWAYGAVNAAFVLDLLAAEESSYGMGGGGTGSLFVPDQSGRSAKGSVQ
jgi:hypothetical protein